MASQESKRCARCGIRAPLDEFAHISSRPNSRGSYCRGCRAEYMREYNARPLARAALRKRQRQYTADNRAEISRLAKVRYVSDPIPKRLSAAKRRAIKKTATATVTREQWNEIVSSFNGCCAYCLEKCDALQMEHIVPLSRGGEHSAHNIVPSCQSCNDSKGSKSLLEIFEPSLIIAQRMARPLSGATVAVGA